MINAKLVADAKLSTPPIKVDADQGTFTLEGTVKSADLVGRAAGLAPDPAAVGPVLSLLTFEKPPGPSAPAVFPPSAPPDATRAAGAAPGRVSFFRLHPVAGGEVRHGKRTAGHRETTIKRILRHEQRRIQIGKFKTTEARRETRRDAHRQNTFDVAADHQAKSRRARRLRQVERSEDAGFH